MVESGIYIRVGKENLLLERMTVEQREEWLKGLSQDGHFKCIHRLSEVLSSVQDAIADTEDEEE